MKMSDITKLIFAPQVTGEIFVPQVTVHKKSLKLQKKSFAAQFFVSIVLMCMGPKNRVSEFAC